MKNIHLAYETILPKREEDNQWPRNVHGCIVLAIDTILIKKHEIITMFLN